MVIVGNLLYIKNTIINQEALVSEKSIFKTYKTIGNCFYQKVDAKKWLFLSGEEIISSGTELKTDSDSHSIFSFLGQSGRLEVSEKSHIEVSYENRKKVIDFKKGEIYINYQAGNVHESLIVKIDGKVFNLTNADVFISGDVEDQVRVSVEYGKVNMSMGRENQSTFEKGQSVLFKNEKEYAIEQSQLKITTPFNYDRYNLEKKEFSVRFAFLPMEEEYEYQLLVGKNENELEPHFEKTQVFLKNEFTVSFPKGSYYWRLAAYKEKTQVLLSPVKRFFIEPQSVIQLVKPLFSSKFQVVDNSSEVQFQWDNPSQLERVFIEISDRKDFSKTLVNESIPQNNFFTYQFQQAGEYYWRVSGFPFGTTDLLSSAVGKVVVVNEVIPQQVRVVFPKNKTELTTLSLKNSDITFQWTKNPSSEMYTVEIVSKSNGNVLTFDTQNNNINIKDLNQGTYQWRVLDKKLNITSDSAEFSVVQTRRLNFSKASGDSGFLSWEQGPRGTSLYRVEVLRIGSRSDFNAFFDQDNPTKRSLEINGDKISYQNFSEGIYAFKVYALDSKKSILADSDLKFLKVRKKDDL